jgi:competence protein ComEC
MLLFSRVFFFYNQKSVLKDGQKLSIETVLLKEPQFLGEKQKFSVSMSGQRIYLLVARYPQFHYGDRVKIEGEIRISSLESSLPTQKQRDIISLSSANVELVKNRENIIIFPQDSILAVIFFFRQSVINFFKANLPSISASLLLGIVFGIKESMPSEFMENLRITGVLHVIAASGMNVTLIAGFLSSFLLVFLKRQFALLFSILGVAFYAVLAGLEPSIVRASIMGILVFLAQILGRQSSAGYVLFLTGFFMLFISPFLIEDIGFQLSFLATLGILYIQPIFSGAFRLKRIPLLGEAVDTTFSAQLATLPILLVNFGTLSLWSVLVNALVLWTVPFLTIIGGIASLALNIVPFLARMLLYLILPLLLYFERVINLFAAFGGLVSFESFNLYMAVGYYLFLLSILVLLKKREKAFL